MNLTRATLLLLLLASVAAVIAAGMRRSSSGTEVPPGADGAGRGNPGGAPATGNRNSTDPAFGGKDPAAGSTSVEVPPSDGVGGHGRDPASREVAAEQTRQRMQKIARSWLDDLGQGLSLSDSQNREIWDRVLKFIADYEALRWRRGVEEDVERTISRMYEKADADISALLGAGQVEAYPGLPRTWEEGLLDPGPGR